MITTDKQIALKLSDNDIEYLCNNLHKTNDYCFSDFSLDIYKGRQKRFISQALASLTDKISFHKKMILNRDVKYISESIDLPEEFCEKVKRFLNQTKTTNA